MPTKNRVLGHTYVVWRKLQHGQEKVIRFAEHHKRFDGQLRKQNGHEHCVAVNYLARETMIGMREYTPLDELMLTWSFKFHDEGEGILGYEVIAPIKTDEDDLKEYLAFEALYSKLDRRMWEDAQRCFLLQFALKNPKNFPAEARKVMGNLAHRYKNEALFFQGVQYVDYLFYGYECYHERGVREVLEDVTLSSFTHIESIASELFGFDKVLWTPERRAYFAQFLKSKPVSNSTG